MLHTAFAIQCTLFLVFFFYMIRRVITIHFTRYYKILSKTLNSQENRVVKIIQYCLCFQAGHKLFLHSLNNVYDVNNKSVSTLFRVCITANLFANVIFILALNLKDFESEFFSWILLIITSEITFALFIVFILLRTIDQIYKPSKMIYKMVVYLEDAKKQTHIHISIHKLLKINLYFELLCSKNRFKFTLGSFGKITPKSLATFMFFYSSMIMFLLPILKKSSNY